MASPTDIIVTGGNASETTQPGVTIATLAAVDADPGDTFTFEITDLPSQALFEIVGNAIRLKRPLVYDVLADMTIRGAVSDFLAGTDVFLLENTGLAPGSLDPARFFTTGQTVNITGPVVIYDQPSGLVRYDADGSGAGSSTVFAVVLNDAALTAASFTVA